ncbi:MAG: ABC transporter ATP-binding protein [Clostridia bacterium]|nr:ABC transporter ATP-binding protein [Clostridia bacterium]
MTHNLIKIENVYKIYNRGENEVRALNGVSVTVDKGEFVAITGHSGSGKSTLMNILGCLDLPDEGDYYLDNTNVKLLNEKKLSQIRSEKIGFVFQGFNLIPTLTALENVELPMMYMGMSQKRRRQLALAALQRVGLSKRLNHKPCEMSGGQQQRVAIARAIASGPEVILADEPTGNLDTATGIEVINLLKSLHAEGKTIILITHDEKTALAAKRQITVCDGKIAKKQMFAF